MFWNYEQSTQICSMGNLSYLVSTNVTATAFKGFVLSSVPFSCELQKHILSLGEYRVYTFQFHPNPSSKLVILRALSYM